MAVKLAKGLWTRDCVDIIRTSIRIWPIRSLKSEYTTGEINIGVIKCNTLPVWGKKTKHFYRKNILSFTSIHSVIKMLFSHIPSLWFCWNSAASEGRKMTSLSCSFHDTRRILQMSCRACSSDTSEFVEVS